MAPPAKQRASSPPMCRIKLSAVMATLLFTSACSSNRPLFEKPILSPPKAKVQPVKPKPIPPVAATNRVKKQAPATPPQVQTLKRPSSSTVHSSSAQLPTSLPATSTVNPSRVQRNYIRQSPLTPASKALYLMAKQAEQESDYNKAIHIIERALRIQPDNAELWLYLGDLNQLAGNADQAQAMAKKAVTMNPALQRYASTLNELKTPE